MVKIRAARPEDAEIILKLGKETFVESHATSAPKSDLDEYVSKNFSLAKITEELNDAKNIFHLIYFEDEVAGYSKIIPHFPNPLIETQNVTKLERLYIKKDFYSQKLGLRLFQFNLDLAKNRNQKGVWLYVWVGNERALGFYRKVGFSIIGETLFKLTEARSNPNYWMYLPL